MRIAVTADTHGDPGSIIKCWKKLKPDLILFAGDFYKDGQSICRELKIPGHIVAGNCDSAGRRQETIVELPAGRILLVHGHQYGVKKDLQRIYYRGRELAVNVVVFGHTHQALCELVDGLWLVNPGSPSRPRSGSTGTFVLIVADEDGFHPRIEALPGI